MRLTRLGLLALSLPATSACFTYRVATVAPPTGADVQASLSAAGTLAATPVLGPNVMRVTGVVRAARGDTLEIAITEVVTRDEQIYYLRGATFALRPEDVERVRTREFDRRRTVIASSVGIVAAASIIAAVRFGGLFGGSDPGGPPTPAMVPP